ncbi:hypothetical protein DM02DRAFT_604794 [Periconia macrospinosa]|uniref:Uncharacterized protein n=1 Tax=Periconia macrospinosa TaxID=97972 RepID=A0A2V1D5M1_9PLEO|nr:hypothetical protein DM02DRAFT_604794 [Periconia macrospinosa]
MHASILSGLLFATAIIASPVNQVSDVTDVSDVTKVADGDLLSKIDSTNLTTEEWESKLLAAGFLLETPEIDYDFLNFTPTAEPLAPSKRQACHSSSIVVDTVQQFVDWDVQMSPVVCASVPMTVSVAQGFSVSNTVSVSAGLDLTFVKDRLKSSLGINYSKSWTTAYTVTVTATVPVGQCGTLIWKPTTIRRYGSVYEGCPGSLRKTGTFMADEHPSAAFEGFSWIGGARGFCSKPGDNPPLSRCQGSGYFI